MLRKLMLITIVCAFMAVPTFADIYIVPSTSQVQYIGVTGGVAYTNLGNFYAGSYDLVVDGVAMQSFCIDLADSSNGSLLTYNVEALEDAPDPSAGPMGSVKATALAELLYENWVPGMSNAQLLDLQVAVWEVVADGPLNLDLTGGSFTATDPGGAATLLGTIDGGYAPTSLFVGLSHDVYQDYVVRVPLPGALLLGLLGLSAAGIKLRKHA